MTAVNYHNQTHPQLAHRMFSRREASKQQLFHTDDDDESILIDQNIIGSSGDNSYPNNGEHHCNRYVAHPLLAACFFSRSLPIQAFCFRIGKEGCECYTTNQTDYGQDKGIISITSWAMCVIEAGLASNRNSVGSANGIVFTGGRL
jgi:hypothetical protein